MTDMALAPRFEVICAADSAKSVCTPANVPLNLTGLSAGPPAKSTLVLPSAAEPAMIRPVFSAAAKSPDLDQPCPLMSSELLKSAIDPAKVKAPPEV